MREMCLDSLPAAGEIGIVQRQCPDGMQVIRQDHDRLDRERTLLPRDTKGRSQGTDMMYQRRRCPVRERNRE
jgi:hypothetical protein